VTIDDDNNNNKKKKKKKKKKYYYYYYYLNNVMSFVAYRSTVTLLRKGIIEKTVY